MTAFRKILKKFDKVIYSNIFVTVFYWFATVIYESNHHQYKHIIYSTLAQSRRQRSEIIEFHPCNARRTEIIKQLHARAIFVDMHISFKNFDPIPCEFNGQALEK